MAGDHLDPKKSSPSLSPASGRPNHTQSLFIPQKSRFILVQSLSWSHRDGYIATSARLSTSTSFSFNKRTADNDHQLFKDRVQGLDDKNNSPSPMSLASISRLVGFVIPKYFAIIFIAVAIRFVSSLPHSFFLALFFSPFVWGSLVVVVRRLEVSIFFGTAMPSRIPAG